MRPWVCNECGKTEKSYGEIRRHGWHEHNYTGIMGGKADLCGFACLKAHIAKLEEAYNRPAKVISFDQGEPDDVP